MNNLEHQVDRAREQSDNEAIDAQMGDHVTDAEYKPVPEMFFPDPFGAAAIELAENLAVILPLIEFEGFVSFSHSALRGGEVTVHVTPRYFDLHFGNDPEIVYEDCPEHSFVEKSIVHEGVKIFCILKCKFQRVAA